MYIYLQINKAITTMKKKKAYEAPAAEPMELEFAPLMASTPIGDDEPEQSGTSDKPYDGEGL